ncbi:MAG: ATP-binding protein [Bacillota bacterium]|nr:ATP-binding protein [Bacillota bacterium]
MRFISRTVELEKLERVISSEEMAVALVYGRRRVGKSELVTQALLKSRAKSINYECKQVAEKSNVASLSEIVSEVLGLPKLGFADMESLLRFIFEASLKEKIVLVLDEYPYLRESIQGMDSILQSLIDKYRKTAKLTLIILGSYVDTMRSILEYENPLYGRVDLTIDLKPMDYYESSLFYPNYSPEDKVRIYSVFGGIPYYNRFIDDSKSVEENIISLIASDGAILENEVPLYLNAQLSKIANANEVFLALAKGFNKYSDILSQSHVSSGPTLADVLEKLIGMEVVSKSAPINDENNRRKVSYRISDNLSSFYYRYSFPYSSQMKIMDPKVFYRKYIESDFEESYVPHMFEAICRQYLIRKNKSGEIDPVIEKIGKYYYDDPKQRKNGEFDIVSLDANGYIFYEVKFSKNPLTDEVVKKEIKQVEETGLGCYKYVFFTRSGFSCTPRENVEFIDLEKLFSE